MIRFWSGKFLVKMKTQLPTQRPMRPERYGSLLRCGFKRCARSVLFDAGSRLILSLQFPAYKPKNNKFSIFTESVGNHCYDVPLECFTHVAQDGGHLGPAFGAFLEEQNERIMNNTTHRKTTERVLNLDTLGIVNGCIDLESQELSYPEFALKNTYGIQAINESQYQEAIENFHRPQTGCLALILKCHSLAEKFDPDAYGHDEEVSAACAEASDYCIEHVERQYDSSGRSLFDVAMPWTIPYTPSYYLGFLSQPWVQAALGVPVNFTQQAQAPADALKWSGEYARKDGRRGQLGDIGYLLDKGVKVSLLYGDRDYSCNCKSFFQSTETEAVNG